MPFKRNIFTGAKMALAVPIVLAMYTGLFAHGDKPIVDIRFNADYAQIVNSSGEEWAPTWADDGALYTGNDDGHSFGGIDGRSVAFGKLVGDDPNHLVGATISDMGGYGRYGTQTRQGQLEDHEFVLR